MQDSQGYRATNAIYPKTGIHNFIRLSSSIVQRKGDRLECGNLQRYNTPAGTLSCVQWKDDTHINASLRVFPNPLEEKKHCLGIE